MIQIGTYVHGGGNIEEKLIAIKEAGFDFVAIGMGALSDGTLDYQVELCKKYGLPIDNIHLTGGKTTEIWFEDELGDKVCERYCREIKMAAAAGIKKGVAHITWGHKDPGEVSACGIARLTKMADTALENDFLLCLENSVFIEHLYATMDKLKDHPAVRFTYDSGHHNAFAHDFDILGSFGDRLAVLHINDNDAAHDLHLMPFDGNNHLRPCPIYENCGRLADMVHETGAHSTDLVQPEDVDDLMDKTRQRSEEWRPVAERLWNDPDDYRHYDRQRVYVGMAWSDVDKFEKLGRIGNVPLEERKSRYTRLMK